MRPDPEPIVLAENLSVTFGHVRALTGLNLAVEAGRVTAVLGPNGAGKTTLLRVLSTLQPWTDGTLRIAGLDPAEDPAAVRRMIGLAGQHAAVVDKLTGRENLMLVGRLYGLGRRGARETAERLVDEHGMGAFVDRRVEEYSGGQRRRLDLAATLMGDAQLLLLDEPTAGLDPRSREALWETVRELVRRRLSVVLTTQDLAEAQALADDVVILDHGQRVIAGTAAEIRRVAAAAHLEVETRRPLTPTQMERARSSLNASQVRRTGQGFSLVGDFDLAAAYAAFQPQQHDITQFSLQPPSLHEAFLTLTDDEGP